MPPPMRLDQRCTDRAIDAGNLRKTHATCHVGCILPVPFRGCRSEASGVPGNPGIPWQIAKNTCLETLASQRVDLLSDSVQEKRGRASNTTGTPKHNKPTKSPTFMGDSSAVEKGQQIGVDRLRFCDRPIGCGNLLQVFGIPLFKGWPMAARECPRVLALTLGSLSCHRPARGPHRWPPQCGSQTNRALKRPNDGVPLDRAIR